MIQIHRTVADQRTSLLEYQRFFHSRPELGFKEFVTAEYICSKLDEMGVSYKNGIAGTGILATIRGNGSSDRCILFRSDMDAVRTVDEQGDPLVAHLCGHDAHMAVMLALCGLIEKHRDQFGGIVKILFQPAEEALGGATSMIAAGVLKAPRVDRVYGFHMWSEFASGQACVTEGPLFAAGDQFSVSFSGTPGHAAMPHLAVDVILAGSSFVQNLQSIVSRHLSPLEPGVISVCAFHGGAGPNSLPQTVQLTGTARTFSENNRSLFAQGVERLARSTAAFFGAEANVQYRHLVPPLVNSAKAIPTVRAAVTDVLSQAGVVSGYRATCVDDFSFYLQEVEGAYILVGCKEQEYYPVHNNNFYVPEESMIIALMILYRLIKSELFV